MCFSKETLLLEPEKSAPRIETLEPEKVDEEEEGKKDESSCSSEEDEEEDSESETEAGTYFRVGVWVDFLVATLTASSVFFSSGPFNTATIDVCCSINRIVITITPPCF